MVRNKAIPTGRLRVGISKKLRDFQKTAAVFKKTAGFFQKTAAVFKKLRDFFEFKNSVLGVKKNSVFLGLKTLRVGLKPYFEP